MKTFDVTHCGECPFHTYQREWIKSRETGTYEADVERCRAADDAVIHADDPERPEWCPLERGEVVVRLRRESCG